MTNEIEKRTLGTTETIRSSGADTLLPPAGAIEKLVEEIAMRMHRDEWEVPEDMLEADWQTTPPKRQNQLRKHARSALAFMREQIQTELRNNNASLDIVKHEPPVLKFRVQGPDMADYQKRALSVLADDYMGHRLPLHREFTLQVTAHFRYDEYGKIQPVGYHTREVDQ